MIAAAAKRTVAIGFVGAFTSCTPAAQPAAPVESVLEVPPMNTADASASTASSGVRFHRVPSTVGDRWRVSVRAESHAPDAGGGEQISTYRSELDVDVLAVEGAAPSRVRLVFHTNAHGYQHAEKPTVVQGRAYVVDAHPPRVTDPQGAVPSEEEIDRVLDVFPDLGTRARVDQVLPDDVMQIGDQRDDLAAAVLRVVHPRAWTLRSGAASLAAVEGDAAKFALTIDASSQNGIEMKVAGGAWVRLRDARLVRVELDGTYDHGDGTTGSFLLRRSVVDR